jgi:hypothetical protein
VKIMRLVRRQMLIPLCVILTLIPGAFLYLNLNPRQERQYAMGGQIIGGKYFQYWRFVDAYGWPVRCYDVPLTNTDDWGADGRGWLYHVYFRGQHYMFQFPVVVFNVVIGLTTLLTALAILIAVGWLIEWSIRRAERKKASEPRP